VSQVTSHFGWPDFTIISLQASMHSPQLMHSSCTPSRMSTPVGQACTQALQSMQAPSFACAASRLPCPRGSPRQAWYVTTRLCSSSMADWKRGQGHM
jgi:hypothetical protein